VETRFQLGYAIGQQQEGEPLENPAGSSPT
jgi:hypothetical protein